MKDCRFCQMMLGEGVFRLENELAAAFMDGFPVNKGHLLVIPKRHVKDWWGATQEERLAIFELIDEAKEMIDEEYHPDGYNIGMNLGVKAGQSVMHLHVHLIPRYDGDVEDPPWWCERCDSG